MRRPDTINNKQQHKNKRYDKNGSFLVTSSIGSCLEYRVARKRVAKLFMQQRDGETVIRVNHQVEASPVGGGGGLAQPREVFSQQFLFLP